VLTNDKTQPIFYVKTSPKIIRLAVMMYVRFSLSLRNVEDLLHERVNQTGFTGDSLVPILRRE